MPGRAEATVSGSLRGREEERPAEEAGAGTNEAQRVDVGGRGGVSHLAGRLSPEGRGNSIDRGVGDHSPRCYPCPRA